MEVVIHFKHTHLSLLPLFQGLVLIALRAQVEHGYQTGRRGCILCRVLYSFKYKKGYKNIKYKTRRYYRASIITYCPSMGNSYLVTPSNSAQTFPLGLLNDNFLTYILGTVLMAILQVDIFFLIQS